MAVHKFRKAKRSNRRRPVRRPRRSAQTSGRIQTKQYARCVESVMFTQVSANTDTNYQFDISLFVRASAVAKNFKFYRAKRVVWTYIPEYNTFQSQVGNSTAPQMSMIMNRTGDNTAWTPAEYDAQGAVPKLFTSQRVIAYKPNLCQPFNVTLGAVSPDPGGLVPTTGILGNTPVYNRWIGTGGYSLESNSPGPTEIIIRSDKTPYYGHACYWYVTSVGNTQPIASVFCEVEWEFKDPLFVTTPTSTQALVATPMEVGGAL